MNSQEEKILMNQVRCKILQLILRKGDATAREIGAELSDIPQASLYRQIKTLSDNGFIVVQGQRRVRGTLECTYTLAPELSCEAGQERSELNIQFLLLSIAQEFNEYTENRKKDKNNLDFVSAPVFMSDEEYQDYMDSVNKLTQKYIDNTAAKGRKLRRVTFVSSPA